MRCARFVTRSIGLQRETPEPCSRPSEGAENYKVLVLV